MVYPLNYTSPQRTYLGAVITDNWPTAARLVGATKPSYERWTATFEDLSQIHDTTLVRIKARIKARVLEAAA